MERGRLTRLMMADQPDEGRGLIEALVGDGRSLLKFTGLCLVLSGTFALFLSTTGHFLPHDVQYLGMAPEELCAINECRIVHFMFHDRVSFGGAIMAVGVLYLWLAEFPLRQRRAWSWWLFLASGVVGFGSFLAYLGYGYLDTWHGVATLGLIPVFTLGMARTFFLLPRPTDAACLLHTSAPLTLTGRFAIGRLLLLGGSLALVGGGATIMTIGMTSVFVPQDLAYMGLSSEQLHQINPRLVPLIAHDRAGFGGGVCTCGILMFFCTWCGTPSRNLWQALFLAAVAGFTTAIGIHPIIGYTDFFHLAPAVMGGLVFALGLFLAFPRMCRGAAGDS
jgi:hypothetical protein